MNISKRTIDVLKNFSTINPSILIRPGNTLSTMAPSKKIMASAAVDESFDREFGIYELSKFLGILSLYKEPELELLDGRLSVSGEGRVTSITYASPETIVSGPSEIKFPDALASFTMPARAFAETMKASGILSLPVIEFVGDGSSVFIRALDPKNPSSHSFSSDLGPCGVEFVAHFKVETFKFIPNDYEVSISAKKIARFTGDGVTYFVASELTERR